MTNPTRPAADSPSRGASPDTRGETQPKPRFLDPREGRRPALGNLKTDEEARLAAEIEKLRG